jgi:hypothetical protein
VPVVMASATVSYTCPCCTAGWCGVVQGARVMSDGRGGDKGPNPLIHAAPAHTLHMSSAQSLTAEDTSMI